MPVVTTLSKQKVINLLKDNQPRTFVEILADLRCGHENLRPMIKELVEAKKIAKMPHRNGFKYMSHAAVKAVDRHLDERILALVTSKGCTVSAVARKFGMDDPAAKVRLESLYEQGLVMRNKTSRYTSYFVRQSEVVVNEVINARYVAPFKPLVGYDMTSFQRLAEGSRNGERGMV